MWKKPTLSGSQDPRSSRRRAVFVGTEDCVLILCICTERKASCFVVILIGAKTVLRCPTSHASVLMRDLCLLNASHTRPPLPQARRDLLVELVLGRLHVVLEEDLDLVVHLVPDVVAEEDGDDEDDAEADGRQGEVAEREKNVSKDSWWGGDDEDGETYRRASR